ncbi:hypothetical protein N0V90_001105 [Kalmusia sp. IMI 367209]|nr:hypothetical protein N0V90_001105 [Kalmusia sp. IMI 367209]
MTGFKDLPVELKLRKPIEDLKAFALVSRQVAPLAQEVLHRTPMVESYPMPREVHPNFAKEVGSQAFAVPVQNG